MLNVANWNDDTDTYVLCYIICPWLALAKKRSPETFKTFLGYAFVLGMTIPVMEFLPGIPSSTFIWWCPCQHFQFLLRPQIRHGGRSKNVLGQTTWGASSVNPVQHFQNGGILVDIFLKDEFLWTFFMNSRGHFLSMRISFFGEFTWTFLWTLISM